MDPKSIPPLLLLVLALASPSPGAEPLPVGVDSEPLVPIGLGRTGFTTMNAAELGITWTNSIPLEEYLRRQNLMNGSGLALGDYDGDGWCDIFLCNRFGPSALYRNLGGWGFEETTAQAGVACTDQLSAGAIFADVNGDSRVDLLVSSFTGPNALFLNLGNGSFTKVTASAGITSKLGGTSMALGDLDGDNDLDLYLCHLGVEAIFRDGAAYSTRMVRGKPVVTGRFAKRLEIVDGRIYELGDTDYLFRNLGNGRFEKALWTEQFADGNGQPQAVPYDMGLAVQIRDINGDGLPDMYVCNDFQTPDRLWLNTGNGRFRPPAPFALRNMSYASMGVDFADIDRDGHLDFVTVEMLSRDHRRRVRQASAMGEIMPRNNLVEKREDVSRNALYWNRGDGTYAEIAYFSGVAASDWSWTPIFLDVDLDGYEDLLISNGHLRDVNDRDATANFLPPPDQRTARVMQAAFSKYPALTTPNAAFRNLGNLRFADASLAWNFSDTNIAHGMAMADLDNDGDMDLVANRPNASPLICRNDTAAPRIFVRLRGNPPNTEGIGAKVTLLGGAFQQSQEIISGGRYLAGDDPSRTFAVPPGNPELSLEVRWRNGRISRIPGIQANRRYLISEGSAVAPEAPRIPAVSPPLFEDVSSLLDHAHQESRFDDSIRQSLLPKTLCTLGPGVGWLDLDQDGYEELIVGSGRGGTMAVFGNQAGKLERLSGGGDPLPDDSTAFAGWVQEGRLAFLAGRAHYESSAPAVPPLLVGSAGGFNPLPGLSLVPNSTGPLAVADIDGDGDLDLFIGGRFHPGRYPEPTSSFLWINEGGQLTPHPATETLLRNVGLVSSALFSDLHGDGFPELVLAREWGQLQVLMNDKGEFTNATEHLGFAGQAGIWTSITSGDFNGDGRMDLVAGNWGLNSYHQRTPEGPWFLFYGTPPEGEDRTLILEACYDPGMRAVVPMRDLEYLSVGFPWLKTRFTSHSAYGEAGVQEVLGNLAPRFNAARVTTLVSTLFWNRGERFESEPLPAESQWTPIMGLTVADFNGDGHEDLFVGQNYFGVRPEDDRLDAGRGLLLAGSANGRLRPMPGEKSGLTIHGEQRGSAAADFDGDGRTDLVVTQNSGTTRLLQNRGATPGLRVRLRGPVGNPMGYGATLWWETDEKRSPAREIHSGAGYWSLDGAIQVLHGIPAGAELVVRWPGGKVTRSPVPEGAAAIEMDTSGTVKKVR